jgi:CubicO group peptidase (beta-lactamase class C family)
LSWRLAAATAAASTLLTMTGPALSQAQPSAPTQWTPDRAMDGGNDRGNPFPVRVASRGAKTRGLPMAARQIAPRYEWDGKTWTVEDYMAGYNVSGVLVLKDGEVILERYAQGRQPTDRWVSQSVAKSVTSLLAGAAIQDGRLRLTDRVDQHVPELKGSAYGPVTMRQLLTMSSGVKWDEAYSGKDSDLRRYYVAATTGDALVDHMAKLPRAHPAGSRFHYNTGETHLAGIVISRAVGRPLTTYLSEKIWKPYGMERDGAWRVDPKGREFAGCCLLATLGDFARLGQFVLDDGVVDGKRILPPGWIAESTKVQITHDRPLPSGYGYFWWIGAEAFEASGIYGQSILIYPKDRLVIVVNSQWPEPDAKALFGALSAFQGAVRKAAVASTRQ